jgi:hypothetical protein
LLRAKVHPLQQRCLAAEVSQGDGADDLSAVDGEPERRVRLLRVVEVRVELGIRLEVELAERVRDERAKAVCVRRVERDDRYGAASSSRMNS